MHRRVLLPLTAVGLAVPTRANAHLLSTGFGPFYDGLAHVVVTPEEILPVLALGLLAGLQGPRVGRIVLFTLPAAWLAGSVLGFLVAVQGALPLATAIITVVLGTMVAAGRQLPLGVVVGSAVAFGLLAGGLDGLEPAATQANALRAAGVTAALFVLVALLAGQAATVRARSTRAVAQVAGSWIAAIGLLMLGWAIRR